LTRKGKTLRRTIPVK